MNGCMVTDQSVGDSSAGPAESRERHEAGTLDTEKALAAQLDGHFSGWRRPDYRIGSGQCRVHTEPRAVSNLVEFA
jgi:hypothetical protein